MADLYIATTFAGMESVAAAELLTIGAQRIRILNRAVSFEGDLYTLYAANMYLRTVIKILKPVIHFTADSENALYDAAMQQNWSQYLTTDKTFAIGFAVHSAYFHHSKYISLKLKDAIADHFRNKTGVRPSVDPENPDVLFHLHINDDQVNISLDSSGESLHKRGYRVANHKAPLNEVLAAGMIHLSGWDKHSAFYDPMCGSGTLAIEAGMIACNIPPCLVRKEYAFKKWNDFNASLYKQILLDAAAHVDEKKHVNISGSDIDRTSVEMAKQNMHAAKLGDKISFFSASFQDSRPSPEGGTVIMNPPYGERLMNEDINAFYKEIGDTMKKKYQGYTVWILSSNSQAIKNIGLRTSQKIILYNGPLECRFLRYDMYAGSKKQKADNEQV